MADADRIGAGLARFVGIALRDPSWIPGGAHAQAMRFRWERDPDPVSVVEDQEFLQFATRSLNAWAAFRGRRGEKSPSPEALGDFLVRLVPRIRRLRGVTVVSYRAHDHVDDVAGLFGDLWGIKSTSRNWVATSKTLYLVLPDLIVPMDNQSTRPFLGRWPSGPDQGFIELAPTARSRRSRVEPTSPNSARLPT
jgi:hypothetical protein